MQCIASERWTRGRRRGYRGRAAGVGVGPIFSLFPVSTRHARDSCARKEDQLFFFKLALFGFFVHNYNLRSLISKNDPMLGVIIIGA